MADSSQEQNLETITADGSVKVGQAGKNLVQDSPGTKISTQNSLLTFIFGQKSAVDIDWKRVAAILKTQKGEIARRRRDTLLGDVLLDLPMTDEPQWVARNPLDAVRTLKSDQGSEELITPDQSLLEIYDRADIQGRLLILGAPGAGKTTALLGLAEALVDRAIAQPQTTIPIIFELSNWRDDKQSIADWLVDQLYENVGGDRKSGVYEQWLEQKVLLPLLDGLDELGYERQKRCTQKIDEFVRGEQRIVVCCRIKEFEQAGIELTNLSWAVQLQALSDRQIEYYLIRVGRSGLWAQIQAVPEMKKMLEPINDPHRPEEHGNPGLLRVPLFVSLAAQVYEEGRPLKSKYELFEKYIDQRLDEKTRKGDRRGKQQNWAFKTVGNEPEWREARHSLVWVATQLKEQNQVDLLIEKIQPSWLDSNIAKRQYWLMSGLIVELIVGLIVGRNLGLIVGLTAGLITLLYVDWHNIDPAEGFRISMSHEVRLGIARSLIRLLPILQMIFGLSTLLNVGQIFRPHIEQSALQNTLQGIVVIGGAIIMLIGGLITGLKQDLKTRSKPNQGIYNSLQSFIWMTIFTYLCCIILVVVMTNLSLGVAEAITANKSFVFIMSIIQSSVIQSIFPGISGALLFSFFFGGGLAVIQHLCLRILLTRHYGIPWNLARFLTYCHERRLLQQIGGRYRFIHRELLDHFANQPTR
jgi:hypothetical protein